MKNKTIEELTKEFGKVDDGIGIMLWIPEYQQYLAISNGDGTNSDVLEECCNDYVYYAQYEYSCAEFVEVDGGQLDYNTSEINYNDNLIEAIPEILNMAYDDAETQFVLLHTWE